ncbi:MAG TPA: penicillin-binding protein 2 [Magnetospirillaceae bacterium]|nr:penicillin-binding protein 2 [Magnetospirillaceae bacterium]
MLRITRTRIILGVMAALGAIFIVRLFYLQVIQHDYYEQQAILEHTTKFSIPANRGLIYAHDGTDKFAPLVLNEPVYTVYADPSYVKEPSKIVDVMRRVAGGNVIKNFDSNLGNKESRYTVLARQVSKTQMELIDKEKLAGVGFQPESKRVYPENALASQTLGFVNGEGQGQYGVEEALNEDLSGKDGQLKAVTDVNGIPISVGTESVHTPPEHGKNVVLTIDRNIQAKTEQMLRSGLDRAKATKGSILVMDPNNGHILALANWPSYNPADLANVTDYTLLSNRAVSDPYEPGSVIKALTMGVGLDAGRIQPDTKYNNTGSIKIQDATIRNVLTSPLGAITMTQVLQFSFNTGAVQVLQWLGGGDEINQKGKQKLYDYFTAHYMFGQKTGVKIAGEVSGDIVSPDDPQGGDVRYANMTFGQGMSASMIQVLAAFAAGVNGGTYYEPQIVDGYLGDDDKTMSPIPSTIKKTGIVSQEASAKLRQMLHDARQGSSAAHGEKGGYYTGGKTGTAQVYDPQTGRYSDTETIGSYVGFGGQDRPQYVIMVRVDDARNGGYSGSAAAAPIFTELSNWMLDYLQIQPKG